MATTSLLMVLRHLKNVVQIITLAPFRVPSGVVAEDPLYLFRGHA